MAETHEVQMVNRSDAGAMAFVPGFVRIAPGDTVRFVATDRGHNAETIDGMIPEGAEGFASKIGGDFEIVLTDEGVYGIKCKPHFNMGMVMTIAVGADVAAPAAFLEGKLPKKAVERFEAQLGALAE